MAVVSMKQLLDSGVQFGTRQLNPKMKRFFLAERNGIQIIDLKQTLGYINNAYEFVKQTVAHGGTILFVGTLPASSEVISEQAKRVGMPYVTTSWTGGLLSNFTLVQGRLQRLKELDGMEQGGDLAKLPEREQVALTRERSKLERLLGGLRGVDKVPSAIWVVDTKKESLAVGEARKLGIPVVAVLGPNADPDKVDYPIPGNDDAIRSIALLTRVIADAVAEGLVARAARQAIADRDDRDGEISGNDEPLADWERDLLTGEDGAADSTAWTSGGFDPVPAHAGRTRFGTAEAEGQAALAPTKDARTSAKGAASAPSALDTGLTDEQVAESLERVRGMLGQVEQADSLGLLTCLLDVVIEGPESLSVTLSEPPAELVAESYSELLSSLRDQRFEEK